jgi:hypothetical protein
MPPSLLQSQLETLEPLQSDEAGFIVPTHEGIEAMIHRILAQLHSTAATSAIEDARGEVSQNSLIPATF